MNAIAESFIASLGVNSRSSEAAVPAPVELKFDSGSASQANLGPAVRLLLSSYGLTQSQITGTGPHGIVIKGYVRLLRIFYKKRDSVRI